MKAPFMTFLGLCLLTLVSCSKEDMGPKLKREAAEKMVGKWMVDRTVSEVYDPLTVLSTSDIYSGTETDYYSFSSGNQVEVSSAVSGNKVETYDVINPYQVMIADKSWRIDKLTSTELLLLHDVNDAVAYRRYVTKIFLKK